MENQSKPNQRKTIRFQWGFVAVLLFLTLKFDNIYLNTAVYVTIVLLTYHFLLKIGKRIFR